MSNRKAKPEAEPQEELESGEQIPLIDVDAENSKEILRIARAYKRASRERQSSLAEEVKHKKKLLETIREAKLHPTEDGCYRVRIRDVEITVKPRDELITVREAGDEVPGDQVSA